MLDFNELLVVLANRQITDPLLFSLLAGALIGAEREVQGKAAGLRTHMLVCFSSALLMLMALRQTEWLPVFIPGTNVVADLARMPHGILTGIGFLGAGVIFREGASVHGLTTAASLWVTAALGIVFGVGMISLGLIGLAATILVLVALRLVQFILPIRAPVRVSVAITPGADFGRDELRAQLKENGLKVRGMSWSYKVTAQETILNVTGYMTRDNGQLDALVEALARTEGIRSFAVFPADGPPESLTKSLTRRA